MKKKNRKIGMALAVVAIVAAMAVPTVSAYANNWWNKPYSSYAAAHNVSYTSAQEKWDDSYSWDDCHGGASHTVEVAMTPRGVWDVHFVGSPVIGWYAGKSGILTNYVWEASHTNGSWFDADALLWFNNTSGSGTTISGEWSPDYNPNA